MHSRSLNTWNTGVPAAAKLIPVMVPGFMIQTPHEFFFDECIRLGFHLPAYGKYGVGIIFFPRDIMLKEECRDIFNRAAEKLGLEVLGYRKVPVNPDGIGTYCPFC